MPEHAARRPMVLVVEDDTRAARVLARMLREDGYDVEIVLDGAAAISRLSRAPLPDVLITDLKMPYVDGLAVASYARSRAADIPVLVVTGYPELVGRLDGAFGPRAQLFSKPLDYGELMSALARLRPLSADSRETPE